MHCNKCSVLAPVWFGTREAKGCPSTPIPRSSSKHFSITCSKLALFCSFANSEAYMNINI